MMKVELPISQCDLHRVQQIIKIFRALFQSLKPWINLDVNMTKTAKLKFHLPCSVG